MSFYGSYSRKYYISMNLTASGGLQRPQYILLAIDKFADGRVNNQESNCARFWFDAKIKEAYVEVGGERFPKDPYRADPAHNDYTSLYNAYSRFRCEYYGKSNQSDMPMLTEREFYFNPILIFDTRYQQTSTLSSVADITITIQTANAITANTHAYAIVISNKVLNMKMQDQSVINIS